MQISTCNVMVYFESGRIPMVYIRLVCIIKYCFKLLSTKKGILQPFRSHPPHTLSLCHQVLKEGNVLFNDTLNTFYLRLYGVGHMVKDHSDSERGNPLPPHGLLFPISNKGSFICTTP